MFYPFHVADVSSGLHYRLNDTRLAEISLAPTPSAFLVGKAIAAMPDPVWASSLANAPAETIAAVSATLQDVMLGTRDLRPPTETSLPEGRAKRHLLALVNLWLKLEGGLPEGLGAVRHMLDLSHGECLSALPVVEGSLDPLAPPAMHALYGRLKDEFGTVPPKTMPKSQADHLLGTLQSGLLRLDMPQVPQDTSLSVYGLRDPAACADFCAARARAMIETGVPANQIAILTASDPQDLARACTAQGVPLSGLPASLPVRDITGETLLQILQAKRAPTPAMVLASLCLSPLMPWAAQTGRDLAEAVMSGHFRGDILDSQPDHRALWDDIRQPVLSVPQLGLLLDRICERIPDGQSLRARLPVLIGEGPPDWDHILRSVQIAPPTSGDALRTLEGVSLWPANESPWRPCHHLIIADFSEGHYPTRPRPNALFLDSEIELIAKHTGLSLRGRTEGLARSLALFEAQLREVSDSVTCLVPWRDMAGGRLAPSAGLSLIARAISGLDDPADLIVDLSQQPHETWPIATHSAPLLSQPAATLPVLDFGQNDLLSLRRADDGTALPQSPSRLETLLVSPLAWLLGEIGAGDMAWQSETLDIMMKGNIAHHVFEHLFLAGVDIPDEAALLAALPDAYIDALRRNAPFLRTAAWELERAALEREITTAALRWRKNLMTLGAVIVGNETWLYGFAHGINIRGKADTLLALPDGRFLVVDHKKSGTAGRRKRMEAGWDLQAGLYGDMLAAPLRRDGDGLDALIGRPTGIAYHLMNDGGILTSGIALDATTSARDMGEMVNTHAIAKLVEQLAEIGNGHIKLNTTADHDFYSKEAGFTPYALQASPLITAFLQEAKL